MIFFLKVPFLFFFLLGIILSFVIALSSSDSNSTSLITQLSSKILNATQINNETQLLKDRHEDRVGASSARYERKYKLGRRYSGRSYKRERHRHSTRVFIMKPANYLLPPLETHVKVQYRNNNQRTGQNQKYSKIRIQNVRRKILPKNNTKIMKSKSVNSSSKVSSFILPPSAFLLPPYEDVEELNYTVKFNGPSSTVESYSTLVEYHNFSTTEMVPLNYSVDSFTELSTIFMNYSESYISSSTESNINSTDIISILDEKVDAPTYSSVLKNEEDSNENIKNFNLLSNDVASLGMKVTTSEKGIEMVKQFHNYENDNVIVEMNFPNDQFSLVSNLATAETGDYWRNDYNKNPSQTVSEKPVTMNYSLVRNPYKICKDKLGYIADITSGCQIFYICVDNGVGEPMLCPNGTLFNQDFLVCDWWYNVECIS